MPPTVRNVMAWNPLTHGIILLREGYYEMYRSHLLDLNYLFAWSVGSVLLAFVTVRVMGKAMRNLSG
jgi:capsular polysaccharide transport system permease protein